MHSLVLYCPYSRVQSLRGRPGPNGPGALGWAQSRQGKGFGSTPQGMHSLVLHSLQLGSTWLNLAPTSPQLGPNLAQLGSTWLQLRPNMAPTRINPFQLVSNFAPTWPQLGSSWLNLAPISPQLGPNLAQLGSNFPPTWPQLGLHIYIYILKCSMKSWVHGLGGMMLTESLHGEDVHEHGSYLHYG